MKIKKEHWARKHMVKSRIYHYFILYEWGYGATSLCGTHIDGDEKNWARENEKQRFCKRCLKKLEDME